MKGGLFMLHRPVLAMIETAFKYCSIVLFPGTIELTTFWKDNELRQYSVLY